MRRSLTRMAAEAVSYRVMLPVVKAIRFRGGGSYPVCPRCGSSLEREYVRFCDRCGQRLAWGVFPLAATGTPGEK